jgi:hypothetical protein
VSSHPDLSARSAAEPSRRRATYREEPLLRRARLVGGLALFLPLLALTAAVILNVYRTFDGIRRGFDYAGHIDYLRYIDLTASLPVASRGWQMYHPPAFYALTVLAFEAMHRLGALLTLTDAGRWMATTAWLLEGALAAAAVRALRGNWVGAAIAAAIVWLLPGQSMMGTMVYNETLTGLGVALVVVGGLSLKTSYRWAVVAIAIGAPLAALSKYSGVAAMAAALPIILWVSRRRLLPLLAALVPGTVMVGAYYGRNLALFGTPFPLNSLLFGLRNFDPIGWGHPPGFFTRFSLAPCSALQSFWGGLWKWFFAMDCYQLAPWRDTIRPRVMVGAVAISALLILALIFTALRLSRNPALALLPAIPAAVLAAFIWYVVRVPSATADKGVYTLSGLVPLAVAAGFFASRLTRRLPAAVVAYAAVAAWSVLMVHASGVL